MRVRSQAVWFAGALSLMLAPLGQGALRAEDEKKEAPPEVTVSYTSPGMTIMLTGTKITYSVSRGTVVRKGKVLDGPRTVTGEAVVKPEAVKELLEAVKAAGFYELDDAYEAKAGERKGSLEIRVKDGEREKRVIYRGADARQAPEAFAKVKDLVLLFALRETNIEKAFAEIEVLMDKEKGESPEVMVSYTSPDEDVQLDGKKVTYRVREMEYARKRDDVPSKVVTVSRETVVNPAAAKELLEAVKAAGFYELDDEYGEKPGYRYYPYEVRVKDGEREKKVVYRSGLHGGPPPEAFAKVEELLVDFARRETTIKKD
jgi:hypothetical protein